MYITPFIIASKARKGKVIIIPTNSMVVFILSVFCIMTIFTLMSIKQLSTIRTCILWSINWFCREYSRFICLYIPLKFLRFPVVFLPFYLLFLSLDSKYTKKAMVSMIVIISSVLIISFSCIY